MWLNSSFWGENEWLWLGSLDIEEEHADAVCDMGWVEFLTAFGYFHGPLLDLMSKEAFERYDFGDVADIGESSEP